MFELNSKMNDDRIDELGENHVATSAENPIRPDAFDISNEEKIAKIQESVKDILQTLGMDLTDDSLQGTPKRVAKAFVNEMFMGLDPKNMPKASTFDNNYNYGEMLVEKNIVVYSTCEHHLLPIIGRAQDVACVIDAKHLCVNSRGIKDIESSTVTSEFGGKFKDKETKKEFLQYLQMDTQF